MPKFAATVNVFVDAVSSDSAMKMINSELEDVEFELVEGPDEIEDEEEETGEVKE